MTLTSKTSPTSARILIILIYATIWPRDSFVRGMISGNVSRIVQPRQISKGLYSADEDEVFILNSANFERNVYNSSSAWLVEFYNEWCGHCIKFAPAWKKLARDVCNWKNVATVAAINCADEDNTQLCRSYQITAYPTLRYFGANLTSFSIGEDITKPYAEFGVNDIANLLKNTSLNGNGSLSWPNLQPYEGNDILELTKTVKTERDFFILVVEPPTSSVGSVLILDFKNVPNLVVVRTNNYDIIKSIHARSQFTATYAIDKNGKITPLKVYGTDSQSFHNSLHLYLNRYGIEVKQLCRKVANDTAESVKRDKNSIKIDRTVNKVRKYDLLNALHYTIYQEVCVRSNIDPESRVALVNYLNALINYLPISSAGIHFLENIRAGVEQTSTLTGAHFKNITDQNLNWSKELFPEDLDWIGCKGSSGMYRGYPCGLWVTFHTLTVHAALEGSGQEKDGVDVLLAILGYVKYFFGCGECSRHFQQEAQTITQKVNSTQSSILWLWNTHNSVNRRISGDLSEDPMYPKIQFPSNQSCPNCYRENGTWNDDEVLEFLTWAYTLDPNEDDKKKFLIGLSGPESNDKWSQHCIIGWTIASVVVTGILCVVTYNLTMEKINKSRNKYSVDISSKL